MRTLDFIESETLRRDLPPFRVGDAVRVHAKVREGEKERIQVFEGVVIRRKGTGAGETFTVRKIASGVGVERIFPVQSPLITKLEIRNRGYVRRSKLYYLRELTGKKARLKSKVRDLSDLLSPEAAEQAANAAAATDEELTEPVAEVAAETTDEKADKKLKGKARKKAKAAEKAVRMEQLKKDEADRAAKKAEEEAKAAAEAEADASTEADADGGGDGAAEEKSE